MDKFIKSVQDPKSFQFQFLASLTALFLLTQLISTLGCITHLIGTSIILLFTTWKLVKLVRKKYFNETINSSRKAVLITGCDTGFGNSLASRLNAAGFTVFAGCLDPTGSGPQQLLKSAKFPNAMTLHTMDVTKDTDVTQIQEDIKKMLTKNKQELWAIVNNAGIAQAAYVEWGKQADFQKVFDVNVIGLTRVTRTFLPLLRKSKGRVINVSSLAGRIAVPGMSAYAMSKHAVIAFSTALRREMIPWGVKVCTIEPAGYKTPMSDPVIYEKQSRKMWSETSVSVREEYGEKTFESTLSFFEENPHTSDPEEVVDAMMDSITSLEPEISYRVCGWKYSLAWFLSDYLPYSLTDGKYKKNIRN